jgi:hypothetical protein
VPSNDRYRGNAFLRGYLCELKYVVVVVVVILVVVVIVQTPEITEVPLETLKEILRRIAQFPNVSGASDVTTAAAIIPD